MKIRILPFALTLLFAFSTAAISSAQEKSEHKEPETELGRLMEKNNAAWRKLRKQAADPASNASSVELVATLSQGMTKALTLKPAMADDVPAADREKFVAAYQAGLKEFLAQLDKLAAAFRANDNTGAQELIKKLGAMQKEDHKEFKRPEH
ncbi:MAG TPA: cytochrome b562 [Lacunisphaera sp.]|nr:cytochrome b562 [Lacunisphaera sp.]